MSGGIEDASVASTSLEGMEASGLSTGVPAALIEPAAGADEEGIPPAGFRIDMVGSVIGQELPLVGGGTAVADPTQHVLVTMRGGEVLNPPELMPMPKLHEDNTWTGGTRGWWQPRPTAQASPEMPDKSSDLKVEPIPQPVAAIAPPAPLAKPLAEPSPTVPATEVAQLLDPVRAAEQDDLPTPEITEKLAAAEPFSQRRARRRPAFSYELHVAQPLASDPGQQRTPATTPGKMLYFGRFKDSDALYFLPDDEAGTYQLSDGELVSDLQYRAYQEEDGSWIVGTVDRDDPTRFGPIFRLSDAQFATRFRIPKPAVAATEVSKKVEEARLENDVDAPARLGRAARAGAAPAASPESNQSGRRLAVALAASALVVATVVGGFLLVGSANRSSAPGPKASGKTPAAAPSGRHNIFDPEEGSAQTGTNNETGSQQTPSNPPPTPAGSNEQLPGIDPANARPWDVAQALTPGKAPDALIKEVAGIINAVSGSHLRLVRIHGHLELWNGNRALTPSQEADFNRALIAYHASQTATQA